MSNYIKRKIQNKQRAEFVKPTWTKFRNMPSEKKGLKNSVRRPKCRNTAHWENGE